MLRDGGGVRQGLQAMGCSGKALYESRGGEASSGAKGMMVGMVGRWEMRVVKRGGVQVVLAMGDVEMVMEMRE